MPGVQVIVAMRFGYLIAMLLLACGPRPTDPPPAPPVMASSSPDAGVLASDDCARGSTVVLVVDRRYKVFLCCSLERSTPHSARPIEMWVGAQRATGVGPTGYGHTAGLVDRPPAVGEEVRVSYLSIEVCSGTVTDDAMEGIQLP